MKSAQAIAVALMLGMSTQLTIASNGSAIGPLIGTPENVLGKADDTLSTIALRYRLGFDELVAANAGLNPFFLGQATSVTLPTQHLLPNVEHEGIVINLPEMRLYYFDDGAVDSWPIGIGRAGWSTPEADTTVVTRIEHPDWYPPASIRQEYEKAGKQLPRIVVAGPDNPLGDHALKLALPGYLLHGTNQPDGVGMRVSHGCIRLYDEHIKALFDRVRVGTRVQIINQPIKWANVDGQLMIEAHQPLYDADGNAQQAFRDSVHAAGKGLAAPARVNAYVREKLASHQLFDGLPRIIP